MAIWADPTEPSCYVTLAYALLIIYVFYSCGLIVLILLRKQDRFKRSFILGIDVVDLLWLALRCVFTVGAASRFYLKGLSGIRL